MHELFIKVLSKRDLSKAGELFSVADSEIVDDINEVITEIKPIITQTDYLTNNNDQSVVEICITRILSCIRETKSAEKYCPALVSILELCLNYNLKTMVKEEPAHAKISADIISSIFLNFDKKSVMETALPVAVKFLPKGNKELSRNLSSYLSLAAIEYSYLLSPHVEPILESIRCENYGLCRLLSQIYDVSPESLTTSIPLLIVTLPKCDVQEKLSILQLFGVMVKDNATLLEAHVDYLCELCLLPDTALAAMEVVCRLAEKRPYLIHPHFDTIKEATKLTPSTIPIGAKILAVSGKAKKEKAQFALDFVLENLPFADRTSQSILLQEATMLCSTYPILFTDKVLACVRQRNNLINQQQQQQQQQPQSQSTNAISNGPGDVNQMSGGITIVQLNSQPTPNIVGKLSDMDIINGKTVQTKSNVQPITSPIITNGGGHVVKIHTTNASTNLSSPPVNVGVNSNGHVITPAQPAAHTGYTKRTILGDSKSTGRLHSNSNTHRSMTRLNVAGGSVGGLHKSMTRLSSSQQINQNASNSNNANSSKNIVSINNNNSSGNLLQSASVSPSNVPPVPPLSSNVIITGHNKWGIPSTKVTSGGVTVTTSPPRVRPLSQGPITLQGSSGALGKLSCSALNQSTGSIQQNSISVQHASPASPSFQNNQKSVMTLPLNPTNYLNNDANNHDVSISGPSTVTSRRNDNTSVTMINTNNSIINQRMSTFEPYQLMRDTVQQFCEKHFPSIKVYMDSLSQRLPPATRCGIEERRTKKVVKLHFACQIRGAHCLYAKTCFTMRTRNPKTWIHLMFLDFQVRNYVKENCALSTRAPGISNLKYIWQVLKCESRSFTELVTSNFPSVKEQEALVNELRHSGFMDVFEVSKTDSTNPNNENELEYQWGCFLCNHPERAVGFLHGNNQPMIEGQLKEKKGKWRLFRRWRTRYFTLSGAHLSCKGSSGESIDVNQIRSVKVSRGARNIPKAFEIFTGDQTLILKPKDGKNAEEWVQCLSIAVAHSQARDAPQRNTNSLPARGLSTSRVAI